MDQLLTTKLFIPQPRTDLVSRPRLFEQLNEGLHHKLTLVSAPAGFGKTTLVSGWIAECNQPAAWISLDKGDSDPSRFLTYFIATLRIILPDVGKDAMDMLQASQLPPIETILTALLNELATVSENFSIVLDDYHVIDARSVDHTLAFLLEHLPPQIHLVITTREDPNLPLARLRAKRQLTEIRVSELRFTLSEAGHFLKQVMGLSLTEENIAALEHRTEGWIAGLQLAAISMQGNKDVASFIQSFTGSHRYVLDYLVEEVLTQQPESVQTFLLYTSILDRMCGPLCDAVLADSSTAGQGTLEYIAQANLFLIPLDNERRWYRYHHLFADLLRQRLQQGLVPSTGKKVLDVTELHLRASKWFEDNGLDVEAFEHAAAANDLDRAERLMDGGGVPLQYRGAMASVLNWLESLPPALMDSRPSLWVAYASALTMIGKPVESIERILQAAETALQNAAPDEKVRDLIGQVAAIRAMLAIPQNLVETIIAESRRALQYLHPENLPVRTTITWTLGYAYQLQGNRQGALQAHKEALSISQKSGNKMISIAAATSLGQIQESDIQLHQAAEYYKEVLHLAGDPPLPAACEAHLGLARIDYEWNDLDAAQKHGEQSLRLAQKMENIDTPVDCELLFARLHLARNDVDSAVEKIANAEQFLRQNNFPHLLLEVAATQVLVTLKQGNSTQAAEFAEKHELPISRARVYLAQGNAPAALAILEAYRQQVKSKDWCDERLKVMILQAIAHHANGEDDQAMGLLEQALVLGKPGNLIRIFVDEGPGMAELLLSRLASAKGDMSSYIGCLLSAFEAEEKGNGDKPFLPPAQPLIEPLSQRELEILGLIAQGLSNREISEQLVLALDTVKGHNRKIFNKLQVHRRTEAVARARELDML